MPASLPAVILARLRNEGIDSCEAWAGLSIRKRRMLFGVTARMRAEIDTAVATVLHGEAP